MTMMSQGDGVQAHHATLQKGEPAGAGLFRSFRRCVAFYPPHTLPFCSLQFAFAVLCDSERPAAQGGETKADQSNGRTLGEWVLMSL